MWDSFSNWMFGDPKVSLDQSQLTSPDAAQQRQYMWGQLQSVGGRQAPQAQGTQLNQSNYDQWRQQQMGLAGQLGQVATGQMKGAGELATDRSVQQALAAQHAAAASARGANSMLAARAGARGAADVGLSGAGQAQMSALQDQASARQQLAGVLGQGASQDIGIAGQNAQLTQATQLANMQAKLQQMGMNDQASLGYLAAMTGLDQGQIQAMLQNAQLQASQRQGGALGSLMGAAGGILGGPVGGALAGRMFGGGQGGQQSGGQQPAGNSGFYTGPHY